MPKKVVETKIKSVSLSHSEIESRAKRIFALKKWVEDIGLPVYYIRQPSTVRKVLLGRTLGDEWDLFKQGHRWYIFLSEDRIGKVTNQYRIKLPPLVIEKIRNTDFSVEGVQRRLAKELGVHESTLSRIRHRIRRTKTVPGKYLSEKQKAELFISSAEVKEFFDQMLTVLEFYKKYRTLYKIKSTQDIYSMCANRKYFSLPDGWHSIRVGESWLLYYAENPIS